jgi:DNA repair protein RecN (Recombination protein N)
METLLKRKYGNTFEEIEKAKKDYQTKIDLFDNREYVLAKLEKEIDDLKNLVYEKADLLSNKRKTIAVNLEKSIEKELKDLYLDKTIFKVDFKEIDCNKTGKDKVEFLISTNVGENLKPLSIVASGGETSRLTLGLNVVFNDVFDVSLAIFDEVDSGVSGKVATSVGEKIKELSKKYQTLVISHLPQVISFADNFYYVYKKVENNKTKSCVKLLDKNEKIYELAKILSGSDLPSDSFIENAKELLFLK